MSKQKSISDGKTVAEKAAPAAQPKIDEQKQQDARTTQETLQHEQSDEVKAGAKESEHSQKSALLIPLAAADVQVGDENDLGMRQIQIKYGGQEISVEADCQDDDALAQLADSAARDCGAGVGIFDNLPQIIREHICEAESMTVERASEMVRRLIQRTHDGADAAAREALQDQTLLRALALLSIQPSGQFELAIGSLESAGMKAKQINSIKAAMKRVASKPTAKPVKDGKPAGAGPLVTYVATEEGFRADFLGESGGSRMLCNFTALIEEDIDEDDGADVSRCFKIRARMEGQDHSFLIPASEFTAMKWPLTQMGAKATIFPSGSNSEHVRAAIQLGSANCLRRTIYTHVGWTKIDGQNVFLHAAGGIGETGVFEGVEVELRGELSRYQLPPPPDEEELRRCIRSTLELRKLAPLPVTCCLEGATFRAALGGDCDTSVWVTGQTGSGKSELATRYQQHFGAEFERTRLPGNWQSTGNSLEAAAHAAKDALFVIDDFCPSGGSYDRAKYNATAERVIRAVRNKAGKQRLTADGRLRATKTPRCVVVSTGEDIPDGHSLRASLMIIELGPDELNFEALKDFQRLGAEGKFAKTMAGFIKQLACCFDERMKEIPARLEYFRSKAAESASHKRTPELVANLMVGTEYFLDFAREVGAICEEEHKSFFNEAWDAIGQAAAGQSDYLSDADSARRFVRLIESVLHGGHAHLALTRGGRPKPDNVSHLTGWRRDDDSWKPSGKLIGWVDADGVYLDPDLAYDAASDATKNSTSLPVSPKTLGKRLRDAGLLASHGEDRGRVLVRKTISNKRIEVLHFPIKTFLGDDPRNLALDGTFVFDGEGPEPPSDDFDERDTHDVEEEEYEESPDEAEDIDDFDPDDLIPTENFVDDPDGEEQPTEEE